MCNCHTIFVIDDDLSVCDSVQWLLESHGHQVVTYRSAEQFLEGLEQGACVCCFDQPVNACLVLDLQMPGMNGLELQCCLNQNCPRLPVIFISGQANEQQVEQAMAAGAIAFLSKPFNDELLLAHIQHALQSQ